MALQKRIRLIDWNPEMAEARAKGLQSEGFEVDWTVPQDFRFAQPLRKDPPDALLIDLSRAPARGRDVALLIRQSPKTRQVPIVFLGGEAPARARIREQIPDAHYGQWGELLEILRKIFGRPFRQSARQHSVFEVYRGRSLVQKLGIRAGFRICLIDEPPGIKKLLEPLPDGVSCVTGYDQDAEMVLLFVVSPDDLRDWFETFLKFGGPSRIWVCWPKQTSGKKGPLKASLIQALARSRGFSEYKVCAIDPCWSAKLYAPPKGKP